MITGEQQLIPSFTNAELGKNVTGFDDEVMDKLMNYAWPGNIRELKYLIERAVLLARGKELTEQHFTGLWDTVQAGGETRSGTVSGMELNAIQNALTQHNGNVAKAAKALGMSQATLYRRLKHMKTTND